MVDSDSHKPVMVNEVITGLVTQPNGYYVDATFGRGGHSKALLERLGPKGQLLALDCDLEAIESARHIDVLSDPRVHIIHGHFGELEQYVQSLGWMGKVSGILLDLGVSSPQLDKAERGFSFKKEGPLNMCMNTTLKTTAGDWLNTASKKSIEQVLQQYGEERYSRRIAQAIVEERTRKPIRTTLQLAQLIERTVPRRERKRHPATRSFQAIRIFINKEIDQLKAVLQQSLKILHPGGRLIAICFHSLESRLVKQFVRYGHFNPYPFSMPIAIPVESNRSLRLQYVHRTLKPSAEEILHNPRARSAIARFLELKESENQ